jgi:hypothetical protein
MVDTSDANSKKFCVDVCSVIRQLRLLGSARTKMLRTNWWSFPSILSICSENRLQVISIVLIYSE